MRTTVIDVLNPYLDKIKILSLDCFDTLLWRNVATPNDVFYDLQQRPLFQTLGITAFLRMEAEQIARKMIHSVNGMQDVKLHEIYRLGFPSLTEDQIHALMEAELAEEMKACYAFPPTVELIRDASARGLKIIIVSNTYLEESQLRRLLVHAVPQDVMAAIEKIFCSCEFGVFKHQGLFAKVLEAFAEPASVFLHMGDLDVDFKAPAELGMHSLRLIQYNANTVEIFRLQAIAGAIADPMIRDTHSMASPFRGLFSIYSPDKPEQILGYMSMGPMMYAYAKFIFHEIEQVRLAGKNPKVLFLMRDAYLPALACEAFSGKSLGTCVQINRFTAIAASFRNKQDILNYLIQFSSLATLETFCRQLLLPSETASVLINKAKNSAYPERLFQELIQENEILDCILKNSQAFRARLTHYLEKTIELAPGDSIIFVDLATSGTTQRMMTPILLEMGARDVLGCYFTGTVKPGWQQSCRFFINPNSRHLLNNNFSLLETLSSSMTQSVIDYDEEGNPIFSHSLAINEAQQNKVKRIQAESLNFIRNAVIFFNDAARGLSITMLQQISLAELVRQIFLLTEFEVDYLANFQLEDNYNRLYKSMFINPEQELLSLHRIGFFLNKATVFALRRVVPLDFVIALMARRRFSMILSTDDFNLQCETLPVKFIQGLKIIQYSAPIMTTADGYFSVHFNTNAFSADAKEMTFEILYGLKYHWLQIDSVEFIHANFCTEHESSIDFWDKLVFNNMIARGKNLFECLSPESSLVIPWMPIQNQILRIVFRPIISHSPTDRESNLLSS